MPEGFFSGYAAPFPRGEGGPERGRKRNGEIFWYEICLKICGSRNIYARVPLQSSASVPDADDSFSPGEALGAPAPSGITKGRARGSPLHELIRQSSE